MGVTSGVRLDFVYRNSGGSVNSLSVVDTSVYDGVTDVSIGYIITLDGAIVYQDSVNTYSVNTPNGTLELEAPYDDNGVTKFQFHYGSVKRSSPRSQSLKQWISIPLWFG